MADGRFGVTFGDDSTPGIDIIMPDITFIEERVEDLIGLVLTHAHEDHIGAVPYLGASCVVRFMQHPLPPPYSVGN